MPQDHDEAGLSWVVAALIAALALVLQILVLTGIQAVTEAPQSALHLAVAEVTAFAVTLWLANRALGQGRSSLALNPISTACACSALLAGISLQLPLAELGNVATEWLPSSPDTQIRIRELLTATEWQDSVFIVIAFVLVAPVMEELLFRGVILRQLRVRYGGRFALIWSSILFGAVHLDPPTVVYASAAGLVLGAVALKTGSTVASMVLHCGVNAVAVLVPESLIRIPGFNTIGDGVQHIDGSLVLGSSAVASLALLAILRTSDER